MHARVQLIVLHLLRTSVHDGALGSKLQHEERLLGQQLLGQQLPGKERFEHEE